MKRLTMYILASILGTASVAQTASADMHYWKLMQSFESDLIAHNDWQPVSSNSGENITDEDC